MKMKIVLLALAFCLLVPGLNAFAKTGMYFIAVEPMVTDLVTDVTEIHNFDSVTLNWKNPGNVGFAGVIIKRDGVQIAERGISNTSYRSLGLTPGTTYNFEILAKYSNGENSAPYKITVKTDVKTPQPAGEVLNFKANEKYNEVILNWQIPNSPNYKSINLYKDGVNVLEGNQTTYTDKDVEIEKTYEYVIKTVSDENIESAGIIRSVTIPKPPPAGDILDLKANAKHDRVDLSWNLPSSDNFKHVNIYRDELRDIALLDKALGFTSVSAAATTKIFETNGTYFNDLTVKPETTYEYKLTTLSTEGAESEGVTRVVETLEEPAPAIIGGGYTKDPETGDFIYSWKEPKKGSVKVKVDGKEYKTVPAADGKITIPKADMKYDAFGDPLVSVQPIGENGKVGEEISESTIRDLTMPFSPKDLLGSSMGLVMVIGGFVLLALSFLFVPKIVRMIKRAIGKESEKEKNERMERAKARVERQGRTGREKAVREPATDRERMKAEQAVQMAKAPRVPRERASVGRSTKAPRIPRERNRRERPTRPGRG